MKKLLLILAVIVLVLGATQAVFADGSYPDDFPVNEGEVVVEVSYQPITVTLTTTIQFVDNFWLTLRTPEGQLYVISIGAIPYYVWQDGFFPIYPFTDGPVAFTDGIYTLQGWEAPYGSGNTYPDMSNELFNLEIEINSPPQDDLARVQTYRLFFPEGETYSYSSDGTWQVQCVLPNTLNLEWGDYYLYGHETVHVKHEGIVIDLFTNQPWGGIHPIVDADGHQAALFQILYFDTDVAPWRRCGFAD